MGLEGAKQQEPYPPHAPLTSLSITHVQFHPSDPLAQQLAYATLAPLAIVVAYVSLFFGRREMSVLLMFFGQLLCEFVNAVLKRILKEKRPTDHLGNGYGMPSSHAQFMFFFATYATVYLFTRVTFQQRAWKFVVATALIALATVVAYSRVYLSYHSVEQVLVGGSLGVALAIAWYLFVECQIRPSNLFHKFLGSSISRYCYIRDSYQIPNIVRFEYESVMDHPRRSDGAGAKNMKRN